ncbi:hypothetical protein [Xylanimonas oleitrophica]|uniref:hypothetical protein n=1 Tax=Xylanimonas oleitrophica TaxID=2607479 RepID=UPI0015D0012D|nr:hypothetical protein [Xylanimonas oleitrophica]
MNGVIAHTCPCGATFRATYTTTRDQQHASADAARWLRRHRHHQPDTPTPEREVNGL